MTKKETETFKGYTEKVAKLESSIMQFVEAVDPDANDTELNQIYSAIQTLFARMEKVTKRQIS